MLLLLLYPLRKRLAVLQKAGGLKYWFRAHMFLGVCGPVLVMYHSTLKVGSLNAAVALYSMLIVAGSGIVGRFFYTKIHNGLYGRQASLKERQAQLGLSGESLKSKFHFAPQIEQQLKSLEAYASAETGRGILGLRTFVGVIVRGRWAYWRCMREVRRILKGAARRKEWKGWELRQRLRVARRMLKGYIVELQDVAQFRTYERLFSLWHVLHVPFVYMLVISAIVHVVYVHLY